MTINATAPILLALYVAAAERAGRRRATQLCGHDPERHPQGVHRARHLHLPAAAVDAPRDRRLRVRAPRAPAWNTISSRGYHMREAGATAAQELAFTLADGIAYVEAAVARGLDVDDFAPRLSFFFAAWTRAVRGGRQVPGRPPDVGADHARPLRRIEPRSMMCRFHVQTAGSSLTAQSIDNNVVRTTLQALAAVLGGTQSLHTNSPRRGARPADRGGRPAGPPDPADPRPRGRRHRDAGPARRLVLRRVADRRARGGGARPTSTRSTRWAARSRRSRRGFQQRQIQESAYRVQREIERGDAVVVGVNRFRDDDEAVRPPTPADRPGGGAAPGRGRPPGARRARPRRVGGRDAPPRGRGPRRRTTCCRRSSRPSRPTPRVGEISDRLRAAWGEHRELITV